MGTEIEIHPIQARVLRTLLFTKEAGFAELNKTNLTNDHFTFHIKRLLELGLIRKNSEKKYELTIKGKEFANRFDTDKGEVEKQAKIGVLVICMRESKGKTEYLVQQRLKQPYYGFHGFLTGKVRWGETVEETAQRELKEETGLTGNLTLKGMKHKMDYSLDRNILEDKYFFVFRADQTEGKLVELFEGGKNMWLAKDRITKLENLFDGVEESINLVRGNQLTFLETKYTVSKY